MENKKQLEIKLLELQKEVSEIKEKLYKYVNSIPMTAVLKGKLTIQIHPINQLLNLQNNGWRKTTESDLKEFSEYIKKETLNK